MICSYFRIASSGLPDFSSSLACSYSCAGSVASSEKDGVAMATARITRAPARKNAFTAPPLLPEKFYRMLPGFARLVRRGARPYVGGRMIGVLDRSPSKNKSSARPELQVVRRKNRDGGEPCG